MPSIKINVKQIFLSIYILLFLFVYSSAGQCINPTVYPDIGLTDVHGMDVYADESTVHAVLVGKQKESDQLRVAYLFSHDYGGTWTKPVIINRKQDGAVVARRGNDAQIAAAGRHIVVAFNHSVELPNAGPMLIAYSPNGGSSWQRGENPAIGDITNNQSYLDLLADKAGNFHLIWLDDREENGSTQGLRYARSTDGGLHWKGDVTLDPKTCTCCWNRLAVLPDQSIAVLYRGDEPHDMRLVRISTDGKSWRNLAPVGAFDWRFTGCPHCGGGIASAPGTRGPLHSVVWSGKENATGLFYLASDDLGGHWSAPLRIGDGRSRESDIAVLRDGLIGVVFVDPASDGGGLQFISSADHGKSWSLPKRINAGGSVADHPRIVATSAGFRVFWTEKAPTGGKVWAMYFVNNLREDKAKT